MPIWPELLSAAWQTPFGDESGYAEDMKLLDHVRQVCSHGGIRWLALDTIDAVATLRAGGRHPSAQLEDRVCLNELTDPVNKNTHLGREMAALWIHHGYGVLLHRPVRKQRNELSRVQVGSNDIVGHLNDSKAVETRGDIGLMIIYCEDTVE